MATAEETQKEDGAQEYTPLTEQAEETVEKNLFRVKGHNFQLHSFKQPTYCALCRKFLWGIFKQGHSCKECRMAVHRRCYANVFGKCRSKEENDDNENEIDGDPSKPHTFEVYSFKTPTFCDHCGSLLYGCCSQGLKCKECKSNVHHRCKARTTHVCGIDQKAEIMKLKDKEVPADKDGDDQEEQKKDGDEEGNTKEDDGEAKEEQTKEEEGKDEAKADEKQEEEKNEEGKEEEKKEDAENKEEEAVTEKSGEENVEKKEDEKPAAAEEDETKAEGGEEKKEEEAKDEGGDEDAEE